MNIYEEEERHLQTFLNENFTDSIAIQWPNIKFDESIVSEFIKFDIRTTRSFPKSFGGSKTAMEHPGQLIFSIHVKPNSGTKRTKQVIDLLTSLFFGQEIDAMTFFEFENGSSIELNEWYITNFFIYFTWKKCV